MTSDALILAIAEQDEVVRSFFGGVIRVTEWEARRGRGRYPKRKLCYSLIVGDVVEVIGAYSVRDAISAARRNRAFVAGRVA